MHAGGGFLADAVDGVQQLRVLVMHHLGEIAAIVQEQVRVPRLAVLQDGLLDAPFILGFRLALPCIDRHTGGGHGRGGVILGGEDVAGRPAHLGAEGHQGFDEHRRLHRHVDAADDAGTGQRLRCFVASAQRHQRRHLALRQRDLAAAERGEFDVGDLVVRH